MRLTCPNCGAQYEVPEEVIPEEGRDVQCSNCGATWFQAHPDAAPQDAAEALRRFETVPPEKTPSAAEAEADTEAEAAREGPPQRPPRQISPEVLDILREEARREAELREEEARSGLETQPNLGLDDLPDREDETERRAREARERMERLKGTTPARPAAPQPDVPATGNPSAPEPSAGATRRGLLPDIDEINPTLSGPAEGTALSPLDLSEEEEPPSTNPQSRGNRGFTRGFALMLALAAILMVAYTRAPELSERFPALDPYLNALVTRIDELRFWLDAQVRSFLS